MADHILSQGLPSARAPECTYDVARDHATGKSNMATLLAMP